MNLSQETLEQYSDSHYYLNISSLNYDVNIINAPVYIAVNQINQTFIDIHHRPLYVYSGGIVFQLDTVLRLLSMNGILNTYGHHQGDLERIFVRLYIESNGKLKLHRYGYEQHGLPMHEQQWIKFQGRIGNERNNTLESAICLYRKRVNPILWLIINMFSNLFLKCVNIPVDQLKEINGNGPTGPSDRKCVNTFSYDKNTYSYVILLNITSS
ncbi:unnamed protein product [Rotaria socialis]|uniref:Uncharacterized protein n=1 Tax=Rotaria socialis TaxID=392032 RepID=A0A821K8M4_9BILA|nr:unnamed protein product [Rotaria socialis]